MHKRALSRQRGFGLLAFVVALGAIAATLVLGYAGNLTRTQANLLPATHRAYVADSLEQVARTWQQKAGLLDSTDQNGIYANADASTVLSLSGVQLRYGAKADLSRVLLDPTSKSAYRVLALYLPDAESGDAPFDLNVFRTTGAVPACAPGGACASQVVGVFSSLGAEREMTAETANRLSRIAAKAQAYFKARMLQDPERNVSVNYFRNPTGSCAPRSESLDLGCLDVYQPLVTTGWDGASTPTAVALKLGLGSQELLSAWGAPIEASNLLDSETGDAPFTMAFRARTPSGEILKIIAIQAL